MFIDKIMKYYYALVVLFGASPFLCLGLTYVLEFLFGCSANLVSGNATCNIIGFDFSYIYGEIFAWAYIGVFISPLASVFAGGIGALSHWLIRESIKELRKKE